MNKEERQKLYTLLSKFYPNAKQLKDKEVLTAWGFVLESYAYSDVRNAVLRYVAKSKYFPDISDLLTGLTPMQEDPQDELQEKRRPRSEFLPYVKKLEAAIDAQGGVCEILSHVDRQGAVGELLKEYAPAECGGCRRAAVSGCPYTKMIERLHHGQLCTE